MLEGIDFSSLRTIVELGPGTGLYTTEIVRRARDDAKIILVEIDTDYVTLLKRKFGNRVIIENTGAEHLDDILRRHNIMQPDLIVSALPFLPSKSRQALFETLRKYTEGGTIFRFEMILRPWGDIVYRPLPVKKKSYVWRNVPPMWIYGIN
jgi:phospholipid N-methyltransferase